MKYQELINNYRFFLVPLFFFGLTGCLNPQETDSSTNVSTTVVEPENPPQASLTLPTSEPSPSKYEDLTIHAFSDMNIDTRGTYSNYTQAIIQQILKKKPAAILGLGDFIDGEKTSLSESSYINMWNAFTTKILSLIDQANIPLLPTPGNHDAYYKQEREIFQDYWNTYKANVEFVDERNYPFYYSFVQNGVFFISLDDANYSRLSNRTAQLTWLREQLSSPLAKTSRARVVYGHIPLYSIVTTTSGSSAVYENGALKAERKTNGNFTLEAMLLNYQVDLVIFAHSHGFYSGHYVYPDGKKLRVISLPCAGGSQRYLVGTNIKTPHGFVEIDFSESKEINVKYFSSSGALQNFGSLPSSLTLDSKNQVKYERTKALQ